MPDAMGRSYGWDRCAHCGDPFERIHPRARFCCRACRDARVRRRRCLWCAEWFDARRPAARIRRKSGDEFARTCSHRCAPRLAALERNPSCPWPANACDWCGRPCPPSRKYCGTACAQSSHARRIRVVEIDYRSCRECGCPFTWYAGRIKDFCSDQCGRLTRKRDRRHRERSAGVGRVGSITIRKLPSVTAGSVTCAASRFLTVSPSPGRWTRRSTT